MSSDGTIAPKERVKITYRPDTGDAQEERELPLRLMVLGDFTGQADDTPVEERPIINVDKYNLEEVLASQNVQLELSVNNELEHIGEKELDVHLDFRSMKDFSPDAIVRQVPELRELLEIREALVALKAPLTNNQRFRKLLQQMLEDEGSRQSILDELGMDSDDSEE